MASITLDTLWINDAADLSQRWSLPLVELAAAPLVEGSVRRYAGGRFRSVTRKGTQRGLDVLLDPCDRDTVALIERYIGKPLLVRDPTGRKFFAVYYAPDITEHDDGTGAAVRLVLMEVTLTEEV